MGKIRKELFLMHDVTALTDEKILILIGKHGHTGYSIFWRLLEYMFRTDYCEIQFDKIELISKPVLLSEYKDVKDVLDTCIEIGLFAKNEDETAFYSNRLKAQRAAIEEKSQVGRDNADKRWHNDGNAKAMQRQCKGNANKKENDKETETETETNKKNKTKLHNNKKIACAEQNSFAHCQHAAAAFDFNKFFVPLKDGKKLYIDEALFKIWQSAYKNVDVSQELQNIADYFNDNPSERLREGEARNYIVTQLIKVHKQNS